eukprot:8945196-Pyramimonas_sp.AAC.1
MSVHPPHVSQRSRKLHRRSPWRSPHTCPPPSTALLGPMGGSTDSPNGRRRMRPPYVSAHAPRASWPHKELRRSPLRQCSNAVRAPMSAHPSDVSWPHRELHRKTVLTATALLITACML